MPVLAVMNGESLTELIEKLKALSLMYPPAPSLTVNRSSSVSSPIRRGRTSNVRCRYRRVNVAAGLIITPSNWSIPMIGMLVSVYTSWVGVLSGS